MASGKDLDISAGILVDFNGMIEQYGNSNLMKNVVQKVNNSGLSGFLTTHISLYYEKIVKEFYTKLKKRPNSEKLEYIICKLRGKEFRIYPQRLERSIRSTD